MSDSANTLVPRDPTRHPGSRRRRTSTGFAALAALAAFAVTAGHAASADAAPRPKKAPARPAPTPPKTPQQKEADRHFKSGVALFKEAKYAEALAEFERAYE